MPAGMSWAKGLKKTFASYHPSSHFHLKEHVCSLRRIADQQNIKILPLFTHLHVVDVVSSNRSSSEFVTLSETIIYFFPSNIHSDYGRCQILMRVKKYYKFESSKSDIFKNGASKLTSSSALRSLIRVWHQNTARVVRDLEEQSCEATLSRYFNIMSCISLRNAIRSLLYLITAFFPSIP